jgi:hypothetical protein
MPGIVSAQQITAPEFSFSPAVSHVRCGDGVLSRTRPGLRCARPRELRAKPIAACWAYEAHKKLTPEWTLGHPGLICRYKGLSGSWYRCHPRLQMRQAIGGNHYILRLSAALE